MNKKLILKSTGYFLISATMLVMTIHLVSLFIKTITSF